MPEAGVLGAHGLVEGRRLARTRPTMRRTKKGEKLNKGDSPDRDTPIRRFRRAIAGPEKE